MEKPTLANEKTNFNCFSIFLFVSVYGETRSI